MSVWRRETEVTLQAKELGTVGFPVGSVGHLGLMAWAVSEGPRLTEVGDDPRSSS